MVPIVRFTEVRPADSTHISTDEAEDSAHGVSNGESILNEDEFYAWKELRLHPLLMKSIYRLGFKEPTPIQRACIPAAAHQGKVGFILMQVDFSFIEGF